MGWRLWLIHDTQPQLSRNQEQFLLSALNVAEPLLLSCLQLAFAAAILARSLSRQSLHCAAIKVLGQRIFTFAFVVWLMQVDTIPWDTTACLNSYSVALIEKYSIAHSN
jgi:hypothetical protein